MSIRMRHTRGHTGNRRSHHALKGVNLIKDKESGNLRLPHHIDEATGMYRGKKIVTKRTKRISTEHKAKGSSTAPVAEAIHDHTHDHANSETKGLKGMFGKFGKGGRPKARSGFGGGA